MEVPFDSETSHGRIATLDQKQLKGGSWRREILHEVHHNRAEALSVYGEPFLKMIDVEVPNAANRPAISFHSG